MIRKFPAVQVAFVEVFTGLLTLGRSEGAARETIFLAAVSFLLELLKRLASHLFSPSFNVRIMYYRARH